MIYISLKPYCSTQGKSKLLLKTGIPLSEVIAVVVVVVVVLLLLLFATISGPPVDNGHPFQGGGLDPTAVTHGRPRSWGRPKPSYAWVPTRMPTVRVHGCPHTKDGANNFHNFTTNEAKREGHERSPTRRKPRQHAHEYTHANGAD